VSDDADPFHERLAITCRRTISVLGADVTFRSNDRALLALAEQSFAGLPRHRWRTRRCKLSIDLRLVAAVRRRRGPPPAPRFASGAGSLVATVDDQNFVLVNAAAGSACVQVSRDLLAHPYHVRYELIELAALTLAARAQQLLPLHAACVGSRGGGLLVLGASGTGKSTLALGSLLSGLELLSEDSVFVRAPEGRASGIANFLHVRPAGLPLVASHAARAKIRASPMIRRRSGTRKFQVDLRQWPASLAAQPLALVGVLVLSTRDARGGRLLRRLEDRTLVRALRRSQPYATLQPRWQTLERMLIRQGGYVLHRARDPAATASAVRELLDVLAPRAVSS
jgi:hypothetical protein